MDLIITCHTGQFSNIDDLNGFQGDLKILTEDNFNKLKNSFIKYGFTSPIFIWLKDDQANILDGHQRIRTLKRLRDVEGWNIPNLPVVHIEAKNESEAKRKILQFCSDFGTMDSQGLYEFISTVGMDVSELVQDCSLRQIDMDDFKAEFFDDPIDFSPEENSKPDKDEEKSVCSECGRSR